jgi:hypothetical protein
MTSRLRLQCLQDRIDIGVELSSRLVGYKTMHLCSIAPSSRYRPSCIDRYRKPADMQRRTRFVCETATPARPEGWKKSDEPRCQSVRGPRSKELNS